MTEGSIARHLTAYALPLILGNLFQLLYNAVDSVVIGRYAGEAAVAAVSAANPVMTIAVLGVSGLTIGASVLMSRFFGAGDEKKLRREVSTLCLFGLAASLVILALGMPLAVPFLRLLNTPEEVMGRAAAYLRIVLLGFPFTFQYNALASAMRSVGDSRGPVWCLAAASVLNTALDILTVGVLGMDVQGAAIATVIAQATAAGLCLRLMRRAPLLRLSRREMKIDRALLRETLGIGTVTALQQVCLPLGKVLIQSVINAQGVAMIAAFNACARMDDFAIVPEQSISSALMTCMAQNLGAGKKDRARQSFRVGLAIELCYGVCVCLAAFLLRRPIMRLFAPAPDAAMVGLGVAYLGILAPFYVLPAFNNSVQGGFRAIKRMRVTLAGTVLQMGTRVILIFLLVPRVGITGAAWATVTGWVLMSSLEGGYFAHVWRGALAARTEKSDSSIVKHKGGRRT